MSTDDYRTSVSDVLNYTSCRWENATSSNHVEFVPKLSVSIIGLDSKKLCMLNSLSKIQARPLVSVPSILMRFNLWCFQKTFAGESSPSPIAIVVVVF